MSWGAYWMYYDCKNCGTHYRWTLDYLSDPDFGRCPNCGEENVLVAESKDHLGSLCSLLLQSLFHNHALLHGNPAVF